jgi:predicted amidohydrolase YtcJ
VGGSFLAAGELGATTADLRSPPRGPVAGVLDLQQALVRFAAALPPDAWLVGAGYDDARLRERRQPTAADLDAVASDRPVVVLHATAPLAVANHFALALAGIEAATPDPAEGAIERDPATGEPTGVLRGTAVALVLAKRPAPSRHARLEIAVRAARVAASRGVTTALEGPADVAELERLLVADDAELLPVRVVLRQGAALARALAAGEVRVALRPGSRLTLGAAELDAGEAELGALAGELGGADTGVAAGARAAAERGLPFTLDGGALEPLRAVAAAVAAGLGVEPALRAVTLDAALALSLESERGSLAAGKLADLVILSQDPLAAPPEALADIEVLRTVVGGVPVYVE